MSVVPGPLEVETRVEAPAETVFAYFTDPERYRRWMGIEAELDPRPGGAFRVNANGRSVAAGHYVELDPPRRILLTWGWEDNPDVPAGSTTVEIELIEDEGGTRVRLRHSGLPSDEAVEQHDQGWKHYLGRLAVAGSGGDPGPDPLVVN